MITPFGRKRCLSLDEELLLLDPHLMKRCRMELSDVAGAPDPEGDEALALAIAAAASGSVEAPSPSSRGCGGASEGSILAVTGLRRSREDMDVEMEPKRIRSAAPASASASAGADGGAAAGAAGAATPQQQQQKWAATLVRALQGCPSVEEAERRCADVLAGFRDEAFQQAQAEHRQASGADEAASAAAASSDGSPTGLRSDAEAQAERLVRVNRVLSHGVRQLAARCRRLDAELQEVPRLEAALEEAREAQRRLAHANEVLKGHLVLGLKCRGDMIV
eukprot:TRINITY_DN33096_c0_g1_i1.p1 TRINITY_DN33096_c0_g1~~TRINITY_DN33096_c0_g1_i1.p1  ORF type:complete len:278 (+),score=77.89 TRINITY_DN33096_c0_g1_i1:114-947(+)